MIRRHFNILFILFVESIAWLLKCNSILLAKSMGKPNPIKSYNLRLRIIYNVFTFTVQLFIFIAFYEKYSFASSN